jgi:hypothetical protein
MDPEDRGYQKTVSCNAKRVIETEIKKDQETKREEKKKRKRTCCFFSLFSSVIFDYYPFQFNLSLISVF